MPPVLQSGIQSAIQGKWVFTRRIEGCAKAASPRSFASGSIWHNSCVPDERAGNRGQERKPRSEEKKRRRERTRGEGDSTGLRHENERLQRRNERLRRENDRLKRKIDHLEKQLATARRAGFRQAAPFAKDRPQGGGGHPGRRAGGPARPTGGRRAVRARPRSTSTTRRRHLRRVRTAAARSR